MAVTYSFTNRDSNLRLTGRMIAQEFISDPADDAIDTVDVYLDRTVDDPLGDVYAAILEKNVDGTPGKAIAISTALSATDDVANGGGTVTFTFSAGDQIPTNTAMFLCIIHQGPVRYTNEVADNVNLVSNGSLAWSGGLLTDWEIIDNSPNSLVTDGLPGVQFDKTSASEPILPTIKQTGILETGRPYEVRITVDEATYLEDARTRMIVHTGGDETDWMEDPWNPDETECRVRFIAESDDLYITVNDIGGGGIGTLGAPITVSQLITAVECYALDGEYQRTVEIGVDSIAPTFADGALWVKEPLTDWAEDTSQDIVFTINFQATTATPDSTILGQIAALDWSLVSTSNPGDMSQILTVLDNIITRWENQREKIVQVNIDTQPSQANWVTRWADLGYSGSIEDGARLYWADANGFAGQWEAKDGIARPKYGFLKGVSFFYLTAEDGNFGMERTPVDEEVVAPTQGAWWVDNNLVGIPTPAQYDIYPAEFTITLHRAAYLIHRRDLYRDLLANTNSYYFTVNGHQVLDRYRLQDAQGGSQPNWVYGGTYVYGMKEFANGGSLPLMLYFEWMWPLLLPPGTYRFRFHAVSSVVTSEGSTYLSENIVLVPPIAPGTNAIRYDLPGVWEFIYA